MLLPAGDREGGSVTYLVPCGNSFIVFSSEVQVKDLPIQPLPAILHRFFFYSYHRCNNSDYILLSVLMYTELMMCEYASHHPPGAVAHLPKCFGVADVLLLLSC